MLRALAATLIVARREILLLVEVMPALSPAGLAVLGLLLALATAWLRRRDLLRPW